MNTTREQFDGSPRGRLIIVVGGQFGSEGKGHLTAQLSKSLAPGSMVIRTGGPNAGHTVIDEQGRKHKLRHLPTPIALRDDLHQCLAARSVVDPIVLRDELAVFPSHSILVDPAATILEPEDIYVEGDNDRMHEIGSTRKGIGSARERRIGRVARTANDLWNLDGGTDLDPQIMTADLAGLAYASLASGRDVLIEAAQGYGLGLHTQFYPYATSADCCAIDALADCRISPWAVPGVVPQVWMAMRPHPIRVAGTSGPLRGETTWEDLGLPPEYTTVTNKIRRVGQWDGKLAQAAAYANGSHSGQVRIGLLMADQVAPEVTGMDKVADVIREVSRPGSELHALVDQVSRDTGCPVGAIGTGPDSMVFAIDAGQEGF